MTDWTNLTDNELSIDQPVTQEKMLALRDNPKAMAEGASGAPEIQTAALANSAVTTDKISNSAVTAAKISSSAVTTDKISNSSVTTAKLNNSAVTNDKISNSSVGAEKFQTGTTERDWVLSRLAAASAGAVGTHVFAYNDGSSEIELGESGISGSNLFPASASGSTRSGTGLSGTWRCMGYADTTTSASNRTTLWLMIA